MFSYQRLIIVTVSTFARMMKTIPPKCKCYLIPSERYHFRAQEDVHQQSQLHRVHALPGKGSEKVLIPPWLPAAHYISMNLLSRRETQLFAGHVLPDVFRARKLICPGDYAPHFIMCPVCSPRVRNAARESKWRRGHGTIAGLLSVNRVLRPSPAFASSSSSFPTPFVQPPPAFLTRFPVRWFPRALVRTRGTVGT